MIDVITIPQGTASATTQEMAVEITVPLCKRVCTNAGGVLSGAVSFSAGTPTILNGTAIFPITAVGTIVRSGNQCCGCDASTRHFAETFEVAMETTTDNVLTLAQGTNIVVDYSDVSCCHTSKARLTATLTATMS